MRDIDKLIEQLRDEAAKCKPDESSKLCYDAATALSRLKLDLGAKEQAIDTLVEWNEGLKAEIAKLREQSA